MQALRRETSAAVLVKYCNSTCLFSVSTNEKFTIQGYFEETVLLQSVIAYLDGSATGMSLSILVHADDTDVFHFFLLDNILKM